MNMVSDVRGGRLMRVTPAAGVPQFGEGDGLVLRDGLAGSADIGLDPGRRRIAVPEANNNDVLCLLEGHQRAEGRLDASEA
jgi:hypothetical protein